MSKQVDQISKIAMQQMQQRKVDMLPTNYAVWFAFVEGRDPDIKREVEHALEVKVAMTDAWHKNLFERYLRPDAKEIESDTVKRVTQEAQSLMVKVMQAMDSSVGDNESYSRDLGDFVTTLGDDLANNELQEVVKGLIEKTISLKEKGQMLNNQLKESMGEITVLREDLKKVTTESQMDALTGVGNRKFFDANIRKQVKQAKEEDGDICLLMIDVDNFKKFNDDHGHQMGDAVLRVVGQALKDTIKGSDIAARYGGEEFAIILPNTPINGAMIVAENIRKTIESKVLKRKDTKVTIGSVTASIGVARYRAHIPESIDEWIERADKALYKSKQHGRNRVTQESVG